MKIRLNNITNVFPDKNTVWVEGEFTGFFEATKEGELKILKYLDDEIIKDYVLKKLIERGDES